MNFKFLHNEITNIHSAAFLLGAAGFLSRLLGVLRDRLLASHFGAGRELDIYYAAFQIPDFISILFLLGAASAAILPIFQEYLARDREAARDLLSDSVTFFLLGAIFFAAVAFVFAPWMIKLAASGFSPSDQERTVLLTRLMLLSPILLGLSGIFSTVVQSFQRFLSYALAPILYNIGIIVGITILSPWLGIVGLALGVVLGALFHFGIQSMTVVQVGFVPHVRWRGLTPGIKKIMKISLPRVLSISLSQITLLVLVALGSTLAVGSIAVFQFAQNLYFVPIGIFATSYAVVVFPRLSRASIQKDSKEFYKELFLGIRSILFWVVPSSVLFIVLRAHLVRATLGAGLFSWQDTRLTAAILAVLAVAMFSDALASLLMRGFYALENTWMPLVINIFASIISIGGALMAVRLLGHASRFERLTAILLHVSDMSDIRAVGLALGFTVGSMVDIWLLYYALWHLAGARFHKKEFLPIYSIIKITVAAVVAGYAAYFVRVNFSQSLPLITWVRVMGQGIASGAVGFAVYLGALFLMKSEDAYALRDAIRERAIKVRLLPKSWSGDSLTPDSDVLP